MTTMTATAGTTLADMNGELTYWGPANAQPSRPVVGRGTMRIAPSATRDFAILARTLNGRTWSGTNALMDSLVADTPAA